MKNMPFEFRYLEGKNFFMKAVPLDSVWHTRRWSGSLTHQDYKESYSLFKLRPQNFLGAVINGIFYAARPNEINQVRADYDRRLRRVYIHNYQVKGVDKACALVGLQPSFWDQVNTMIVEIRGIKNAKVGLDELSNIYDENRLVLFSENNEELNSFRADTYEDPYTGEFMYVVMSEEGEFAGQVMLVEPHQDLLKVFFEDGDYKGTPILPPGTDTGQKKFAVYNEAGQKHGLLNVGPVTDKDSEDYLYTYSSEQDQYKGKTPFYGLEFDPKDTGIFFEDDLYKLLQPHDEGTYEYYHIPELDMDELVGLSINGVLYCHPDHVRYVPEAGALVVKALEIKETDIIHIIFNIRRRTRKRRLLDVARYEEKNFAKRQRFPVLEYLQTDVLSLYVDGQRARDMSVVRVVESDTGEQIYVCKAGQPTWGLYETESPQAERIKQDLYLQKDGQDARKVKTHEEGEAPDKGFRWW